MEKVIFIAIMIFYFLIVNRILGLLQSTKSDRYKSVFREDDTNFERIKNFLTLLIISSILAIVTYFFVWVKFLSE